MSKKLSRKSFAGILVGMGWSIIVLVGVLGNSYPPTFRANQFDRSLFWRFFPGMMFPRDILSFIEIPYSISNFFNYRLPLSIWVLDLFTVAVVVLSAILLAGIANIKVLIRVFSGLLAFHVVFSVLSYSHGMMDSGFRFYAIRWSLFGSIIPIGALILMFEDLGINKQKSRETFGFNSPNNPDQGIVCMPTAGNSSLFVATEPLFLVQLVGTGDRLFSLQELGQMAKTRTIQSSTLVQHKDQSYPVAASTVPGVFSSRQYVTTLLLSFFLGGLGVDRFYLGQTGLGIGKLLTLGGCGIWSLIDFIMIAMRNVADVDGKPLA